jgi:threonine/homoserine/homoserine lactone efflux protein
MNLSFLPALFFVHWAAVITPGANFLVVSNHALAYSRRAGLMTVRGVVTGSTCYIFSGQSARSAFRDFYRAFYRIL